MKNATSPLKGPILLLLTLLCTAVASVQMVHAATITVMNNNDSGAGSLRQALAAASNGDTIDATGISGTITLTTGELAVVTSVTINGPGAANLAVNGNHLSRVFNVGSGNSGQTVTIDGLAVTNGSPHSVTFPTNAGGGILNDHATLTISNSTVSGNSAGFGGGIFNYGDFGSATLTISNSTLSGNSAGGDGGAIGGDGTLTISNSTLSGNSARDDGGGIDTAGDAGVSATLTITNSTLSDNSAGSFGGGIHNSFTNLTVTNSTLSGNSASQGGGIWNAAPFSGETSTICNSTLSGNSAGNGGGIFNSGGTVTISNSTLSGNSASFTGGGILLNDFNATATIGSTILKRGDSGENIHILGLGGTIISNGYNLSSDSTGPNNGTTDQINTDPMLRPLQNNGGPTLTHALMTGSPAIDKGKNLSGATTDQRGSGFDRTFDDPSIVNATGGDGTDIGAFEVQVLLYAAQVQQPINADGTSVFNVRRGVVPVKFTLTLDGVATCNLPPATIVVTRTAGGVIGPIAESVYTGPADTGSNFRISGCQYIYNLSASALGVGTYRVDILINGQVVGSGIFGLN